MGVNVDMLVIVLSLLPIQTTPLADLAERGRKRATMTGTASILRCFGTWLQDSGKVLRNPARDLPIPDDIIPELPKPPLEEAQVADIIDRLPRRSARDLRNRAIIEVRYGCGLRLSEVVMLDMPTSTSPTAPCSSTTARAARTASCR